MLKLLPTRELWGLFKHEVVLKSPEAVVFAAHEILNEVFIQVRVHRTPAFAPCTQHTCVLAGSLMALAA